MRLARRTRAKHRMLRPTPLLGRRADQEDALATLAPRLSGVRLAPFRKLLMRTSRRVAIDDLQTDESCSDAHRSRSGRVSRCATRRQRVTPLFELHWREADDHERHG